ncbi:hypothetical protein VTN49DRAFT_8095 [Thermomyces lanuginosus]|uniref:uncharacterized protein n=1 Tax=Thermomyces lanuginosus TaxID=5541 RepID=UPI0037426BF5
MTQFNETITTIATFKLDINWQKVGCERAGKKNMDQRCQYGIHDCVSSVYRAAIIITGGCHAEKQKRGWEQEEGGSWARSNRGQMSKSK